MEHGAAWGSCEFQLANWTFEEPAAAGFVPMEYASIDIFGTCYSPQTQAYVPEPSEGQLQLVQSSSYYSAGSPQSSSSAEVVVCMDGHSMHSQVSETSAGNKQQQVVDLQNGETADDSRVSYAFDQVEQGYKDDIDMMKVKMHRYPASLRDTLDKSYKVPRFVAMGPYHHHEAHLKPAEELKHVAVIHCVRQSGHSLQEMYDAVVPIADDARRLYDKDVMAGIGYDDFRHMMFFDACFLVQYMLMYNKPGIDPTFLTTLGLNSANIFHDVMLLENQLPWQVVETVMGFRTVSLRDYINRRKTCLQDKVLVRELIGEVEWDEDYKPPHHLGLLRYYIVGRGSDDVPGLDELIPTLTKVPEKVSDSASAIVLAQIGIKLKPQKKRELVHMGLEEGTFFPELYQYLAPLTLDRDRAGYLVNMVALELCTVERFLRASDEDTAVFSYLLLLASLVYREKDVHELRKRGLLQGGGHSNDDTLRFFKSLQGLRQGQCYYRARHGKDHDLQDE